jgi:hypothetical protein
LAAYYKLDEIEAAGNDVFDVSAIGTAYNGNHAEKGSGVNRSTLPVSASFTVSGKVMYEGGNYPVEGCTFEVDDRCYIFNYLINFYLFDD